LLAQVADAFEAQHVDIGFGPQGFVLLPELRVGILARFSRHYGVLKVDGDHAGLAGALG
jgi:hypothetical protein